MKRWPYRFAALIGAVAVAVSISSAVAAPTWVEIRAPFTGYWDRFGQAPPCCHLGTSPGDWATDYYQQPGTTGYWYAYSSSTTNAFVTAQVALQGNTCGASSWTYAGLKYRVSVTNDSGDLGWFQYDHVDPDGGYYFVAQGSYVTNGFKLGKTYMWAPTYQCWEVNNNDGVHWHVVGYNNSAYSCYPPHAAGASLTRQTGLLGVVGSNATATDRRCW